MADESRMHRFRLGDVVSWEDSSEHPPVQYEGEVTGFANEELTYLTVDFKKLSDEGEAKGKVYEKTVTEDEVRRVA